MYLPWSMHGMNVNLCQSVSISWVIVDSWGGGSASLRRPGEGLSTEKRGRRLSHVVAADTLPCHAYHALLCLYAATGATGPIASERPSFPTPGLRVRIRVWIRVRVHAYARWARESTYAYVCAYACHGVTSKYLYSAFTTFS